MYDFHNTPTQPLVTRLHSPFSRARMIMLSTGILGILVMSTVAYSWFFYHPNHQENAAAQHTLRETKIYQQSTSIDSLPTVKPTTVANLEAQGRWLYHGNRQLREIALTFDDGPSIYTQQVLTILKQYNIHATFFCVGNNIRRYPSLVKAAYQDGNVIGNHTMTHADLSTLAGPKVFNEIDQTAKRIHSTTAVQPTFFRPPYGAFNNQTLVQIEKTNSTTVLWNVDPKDWSLPGISAIEHTVLTHTDNGSIILMHDGGGRRFQTVAALPIIISTLKAKGFQFVTMQQMVVDLQQGDSAAMR